MEFAAESCREERDGRGKENEKQEAGSRIRLSPRLKAVAAFVPEGFRAADIGTDHGYIPIYLVETGRVPGVLAMDVGKGPLERAKAHTEAMNPELRDRIELRLSDGLKGMKTGEARTVIIAGMGGELMIRILDEGRHVWESVDTWVLSPQSELEEVRRFLLREGFAVLREQMVKDNGKFYTVMAASRGKMECEQKEELRYGPCLIRDKNPVLLEYLAQEEKRILGIREGFDLEKAEQWTPGQRTAFRQLGEELELIGKTRRRMGHKEEYISEMQRGN